MFTKIDRRLELTYGGHGLEWVLEKRTKPGRTRGGRAGKWTSKTTTSFGPPRSAANAAAGTRR